MMVVRHTSAAWHADEGEEVRLARRVQLFVGDASLGLAGELSVTTHRVAFQPESSEANGDDHGFSLYYPAIVMHAVSRDTTGSFTRPCIYLQLDGGHKLDLGASHHGNGSSNGHAAAPMDVCDSRGGSAPGAEDEEDEDEEDEEAQELRLVPLDPDTDGGMDAALDRLFEALSECAALNPDPGAEGEEGEEEYEDGEGEEGDATPEQLAMLARYDAMLDASSGNTDGRYDDPDEQAQPPAA